MRNRALRFFLVVVIFLMVAGLAEASLVPERRKSQFPTGSAYAVFPYPYSLPGIGTGLGLVGGAMNINDTYTDAYGMIFGGDVKGLAAGVADLHVIPKTFIVDLGYSGLSAATIQNYSQRGMSTNKHDYTNIELGDSTYYGSRTTATFFDRRFEFYGAYYQGSSQVKSIREPDGTLLFESQSTNVQRGHVSIFGTRVDLTDDYSDPRRGFRLDITRTVTPPKDSGPDYYVQDINATAYVPLGRRSTWAFNYYKSDAVVQRKGETNEAAIALRDFGYLCNSLTGEKETACNEYTHNTALNNTYGTASSLGGFSRLRSYSTSRFTGAHTEFYGSEIRWNLTDEATPFDIFVMKDIRTSWQVAAFYEIGSTADIRSEVGDIWRSSYGLGLRVITASGVVFRADVAAGREGIEPEIFIGYPWEF